MIYGIRNTSLHHFNFLTPEGSLARAIFGGCQEQIIVGQSTRLPESWLLETTQRGHKKDVAREGYISTTSTAQETVPCYYHFYILTCHPYIPFHFMK